MATQSAGLFVAIVLAGLQLLAYIAIDSFFRMIGSYPLVWLWQAVFFGWFGYFLVCAGSDLTAAGLGLPADASKQEQASTATTVGSATAPSAAVAAAQAATLPPAPATSAAISEGELSPFVQRVIQDTLSQRLDPAEDERAGCSTTHFAPHQLVFPYPFEQVLHALKNKFKLPNDPLNPTVQEVRLISEDTIDSDGSEGLVLVAVGAASAQPGSNAGTGAAADPVSTPAASPASMVSAVTTASSTHAATTVSVKFFGCPAGEPITVRRREIVSSIKEWIPSLMRWAFRGYESLTLEETAVIFHSQRLLHVTLKNRELQGIGKLQDQALYYAHPANKEWTVYTSHLDLQGTSRVGNQVRPASGTQPSS